MKIHPHWEAALHQAKADFKNEVRLLHGFLERNPDIKWPLHRYYQIAELQSWCYSNQPAVVVELGSGYTTVILDCYAKEFVGKRIVSVEEDEAWRQHVATKIMPEWASVEWFVAPRIVEGNTVRYERLPDLPEIDLLYVDGPNADYMGKSLGCLDAVRLVQAGVKVNNVLFDMRNDSVDLFREVAGYGFEPGGSYKWSRPAYLRPLRHHSWFWRRA